MNWGEFKKLVEAKGVTDDMEIWYIDVHNPGVKYMGVYPQNKNDPKDLGLVVADL